MALMSSIVVVHSLRNIWLLDDTEIGQRRGNMRDLISVFWSNDYKYYWKAFWGWSGLRLIAEICKFS